MVLRLLLTHIHSRLFGCLRGSLFPLTALRLPLLRGTLLGSAQAALGTQARHRLRVAVALRYGFFGRPGRLPIVVLLIVGQIGLHELDFKFHLFPL